MFLPDLFQERDLDEIKQMVERYPLATCVVNNGTDFEINHLPMMWRGDKLIGHIAKENTLHKNVQNGCKAVFIFTSEDSYISPNWYPTKAKHHKHVPTWNYQAVHMHGALFFSYDTKDKMAAVGQLTKHHETQLNGDKAWKMRDAPKDYMKTMLDGIVAIEFQVQRLEAKSKISQNRQKEDYMSVMAKMGEQHKHALQRRMKKNIDK